MAGLCGKLLKLTVSVLCKSFPRSSFLDFPPMTVFRSLSGEESYTLFFFSLLS